MGVCGFAPALSFSFWSVWSLVALRFAVNWANFFTAAFFTVALTFSLLWAELGSAMLRTDAADAGLNSSNSTNPSMSSLQPLQAGVKTLL